MTTDYLHLRKQRIDRNEAEIIFVKETDHKFLLKVT